MINLSFDFSTFGTEDKAKLEKYQQYLEENNVPDHNDVKVIENLDEFIIKAREMLVEPTLSTDGKSRQWAGKAKDPKAMIKFIKDTFKCDVVWCQRSTIGANYGLFADSNIGADIGNGPIRRVYLYIMINKDQHEMYKLDDVIDQHTVFYIEDAY